MLPEALQSLSLTFQPSASQIALPPINSFAHILSTAYNTKTCFSFAAVNYDI